MRSRLHLLGPLLVLVRTRGWDSETGAEEDRPSLRRASHRTPIAWEYYDENAHHLPEVYLSGGWMPTLISIWQLVKYNKVVGAGSVGRRLVVCEPLKDQWATAKRLIRRRLARRTRLARSEVAVTAAAYVGSLRRWGNAYGAS